MIIHCTIPQKPVTYAIVIESGAVTEPGKMEKYLPKGMTRYAIVVQEAVATLYGYPLREWLLARGFEAWLFSFPNGEGSKTRHTKEIIENQMFEKELGRDTCLIAIGGGVATDLGGFLAATYCRGIPLVSVPTTLLGMVDASIGGKTGVNVPYGKNLIGSVYQPQTVVIDPNTLKSLPQNELKNGLVEMLKHGIIADKEYFNFIDRHATDILSLDKVKTEQAIAGSCRIKAAIVMEDEKEGGKRHLLNFGHTVGHALETLTDYALTHGEAVAAGIIAETDMAVRLGHMAASTALRIRKTLERLSLVPQTPLRLTPTSVMDAMKLDKKSLKGHPRFVIIKEVGEPLNCDEAYCSLIDDSIVAQSLKIILNNKLEM